MDNSNDSEEAKLKMEIVRACVAVQAHEHRYGSFGVAIDRMYPEFGRKVRDYTILRQNRLAPLPTVGKEWWD